MIIRRWTGGRAPAGPSRPRCSRSSLGLVSGAGRGGAPLVRRTTPQSWVLGGLGIFGVRLRHQLLRPFVFDSGLLRRGQGGDERGLLLHGQRWGPPRRDAPLRHHVPGWRSRGVPLDLGSICHGRGWDRVAASVQTQRDDDERDEGGGDSQKSRERVGSADALCSRPSGTSSCAMDVPGARMAMVRRIPSRRAAPSSVTSGSPSRRALRNRCSDCIRRRPHEPVPSAYFACVSLGPRVPRAQQEEAPCTCAHPWLVFPRWAL